MSRPVKWVGLGIAVLVLLALLVTFLLPSLVNLERYRTLLAQRVARSLGRDVALGALRVSLWGGVGAEAKGVRVGQAPGFGAEPFLAADALRIRVELLPLLRGQVKVTSAVLERPRVRLVRLQDGRWSVDDLFKSPPPGGPSRSPGEPARPGKVPLAAGLVLADVSVRNGEVALVEHDRADAAGLSLVDLDLTLRQTNASDPVDLRARGRLVGPVTGRVDAMARIQPGEKDGPGVDGTVAFAGVEGPGWQALPSGGGGEPAVAGPVAGEVRLTGPLAQPAFAGTLDLKAATVRLGGAFEKPAGEEARVAFQGRREAAGIRFTDLTVTFRGMTLGGTVHLPDMTAPRLTFAVASPRLDLDRLLAVPQKRTWSPSGVAWAAAPKRAVVPAADLDAEGRLSVGEVAYHGLAWSAVEADLRYREGVVRLPRVRAKFAGGTLQAKGQVDLRSQTPRVLLTSRLEKAATEPLVKALANGTWNLTSGLEFDAQLESAGATVPEILASTVGSGSVELRDGRVTDYQPLDRVAELVAPVLAAQGLRVRLNEFDRVSGHYTIEKGVLRTTDLTLTKPEGTVTAMGTVGLLDSALDFDVVAKFGRSTIEAKVTGTTEKPIVVPKLSRLQRRIEGELDKILPEGQSRGLKDLLRGLFRR
jgi:AsmA protein